jgi:formylmethanofuran dehydrogenase subunit B
MALPFSIKNKKNSRNDSCRPDKLNNMKRATVLRIPLAGICAAGGFNSLPGWSLTFRFKIKARAMHLRQGPEIPPAP